MIRLRVDALSFCYDPVKDIFRDFSLELEGSGPFVVLGPSGCGKTTLLKLLGGLEKPLGGSLNISGDREAGGVSFVFQEPRLLPWHTVLENVSLPVKKFFGSAAAKRAASFLDLVSLGDKLNAYPEELSGGEKQRVSLARAFAYPAALILMDEPFQSVDIPLRIELMKLTRGLLKNGERALILVTHDPREALCLGKRVMVLGGSPCRIVFDRETGSGTGAYVPETGAALGLERELIAALEAVQN